MFQEQRAEFPGPAGHLEGLLPAAHSSELTAPTGLPEGLIIHQKSQGDFSGGTDEEDDVGAALDFLAQGFDVGPKVLAGSPAVILAGYSFGAVVALAYCHRQKHNADHLVLVSPPPFLLPAGMSLEAGVLRKIIVGETDELAPP